MAIYVDAVRRGYGLVEGPIIRVGAVPREHKLAGSPEGDEVGGSRPAVGAVEPNAHDEGREEQGRISDDQAEDHKVEQPLARAMAGRFILHDGFPALAQPIPGLLKVWCRAGGKEKPAPDGAGLKMREGVRQS